ncbi:MAG: hypothetical protein JSS75_13515 [Bacteroidetes bacterium]|nr:hypothetical protein [Bacteroidota bacterium]
MVETTTQQPPVAHPELPAQLQYTPKRRNRPLVVFQWAVIIIAGTGFTYKFIEFTYSIFKTGNDIVQFAVTPIVMYSCVAIGFFSMFMWTVVRGDYKDIERPKFRLFERELELGNTEFLDTEKHDAREEVISIPISKN